MAQNKYMVGSGKADITYLAPNIGSFGWGNYEQRLSACADSSEIQSKLYARAVSILDPVSKNEIVYVLCDLGAIFEPVREGVIAKIRAVEPGFDKKSIIFTATHTHNAMGAMSKYAYYMMPNPGFHTNTTNYVIDNVYKAVVQARSKRENMSINLKEGAFAPHVPVAYNRSIRAYNDNPDRVRTYQRHEANLAINRKMKVLNFENAQGNTVGFINWFGVHPNEIQGDTKKLTGSSKGYAGDYGDAHFSNKGFALFAQEAAGDVQTNDQQDPKAFETKIRAAINDPSFVHDKSSIAYSKLNGLTQANKAIEISNNPARLNLVSGAIDNELVYVNFHNLTVKAKYTNTGCWDQKTMGPAYGYNCLNPENFYYEDRLPLLMVGMHAAGIVAGGITAINDFFNPISATERRYREDFEKAHSPKKVFLDAHNKKVLSLDILNDRDHGFIVNGLINTLQEIDPVVKEMVTAGREMSLISNSLSPQVLPLQINILGNVALINIPTEITTMAAERLKKSVLAILRKRGVVNVLLTSYANEYSGYTTTPEEYMFQRYEGAHTPFGKYQLPAFIQEFEKIATEMLKPKGQRNLNYSIVPPVMNESELAKRRDKAPFADYIMPCNNRSEHTNARVRTNEVNLEEQIKTLNSIMEGFGKVNWNDPEVTKAVMEMIDFDNIKTFDQFMHGVKWNEISEKVAQGFEINYSVYPNPSTNNVIVRNNNNTEVVSAVISDVTGNNVSSQIDINYNQNHADLNISKINPGVYFIKINNKAVVRFIKN